MTTKMTEPDINKTLVIDKIGIDTGYQKQNREVFLILILCVGLLYLWWNMI